MLLFLKYVSVGGRFMRYYDREDTGKPSQCGDMASYNPVGKAPGAVDMEIKRPETPESSGLDNRLKRGTSSYRQGNRNQ